MSDYLPGCYRNLACGPDESFAAYLLRLAVANRYNGILGLLNGISLKQRGSLEPRLVDLRASTEQLEYISRAATGERNHLIRYHWRVIADEAVFFNDCRVDIDALLSTTQQVCPQCLAERGYSSEDWDLAPVTTCSIHCTWLIDRCPSCGKPISLRRPQLFLCGNCNFDLRLGGSEKAPPDAVRISEHFASLAPFRCVTNGHSRERWDTMFSVFKAMSLPLTIWATKVWPKSFVRTLSLEFRRNAALKMCEGLDGATYVIGRYRPIILKVLQPLCVIPKRWMSSEFAFNYLRAEVGLSLHMVKELSGFENSHIHGSNRRTATQPPVLAGLRDVGRFLDTDDLTVVGLIDRQVLSVVPQGNEGFDFDEVLACQVFLNERLLSLEDLESISGTKIDVHELARSGLLSFWNRRNVSDHRVALDDVLELHLKVVSRIASMTVPSDSMCVQICADSPDEASHFERVSLVVNKVISGMLTHLSWSESGYQWSGIRTHIKGFASIPLSLEGNVEKTML